MNLIKLLFPIPSPPSWGMEVEYSQEYYSNFNESQYNLDFRLSGHDDGSGPREILLPPLDINNFKGLIELSQMLTILEFDWKENEDYGMGRHIHYRPMLENYEEKYFNFLKNNMFNTKNHIAVLSLTPFLTPNTGIANNKIQVGFRDSLSHWSFYVDHPTDHHYAYISVNPSTEYKPTTIEFRHNESHPIEAYSFIYLVHHLLNNGVVFKINDINNDNDTITTKIDDNYQFTEINWEEFEIPIETLKYMIKKIMEKIPNDSINNKIKYHIWQVYQNILKNNRIIYNDDIYKYYNYKYDNKIKDIIEDIVNNNVKAKLKVNKVEINQDYTILYATKAIIESPKIKKVIEIKSSFNINDYVKVKPSPSKKSTKTIDITL